MSLSKELAQFAAQAVAADIPTEGWTQAKAAVQDCLACILAGQISSPSVSGRQAFAQGCGALGNVPALGTDMRLAAAPAAFANGTAAHALDFDDNFVPALTHASAVVVPALISGTYLKDTNLESFLLAYCVGLEVQARLGRVMQPQHYTRGWHSTSTIGTIGAAAAVAKLMGQSDEQILAAMSIASSMAGGSKIQFGTSMKPAHAGLAAHNGVLASCLAAAGVRGQLEFVEGRWGMIDLMSGESDDHEFQAVSEKDDWAVADAGLWIKRFPCCAAAHQALDVVLQLREREGLTLENVNSVRADLPEMMAANLRFDLPKNESEARFSFSYPAAVLLHRGRLSLHDFDTNTVRTSPVRPHLQKFSRRIVASGGGTVADYVSVEIETSSGKRISSTTKTVKGSPADPLEMSVVRDKLVDCLAYGGVPDRREWLESFGDLPPDASMNTWFTRCDTSPTVKPRKSVNNSIS